VTGTPLETAIQENEPEGSSTVTFYRSSFVNRTLIALWYWSECCRPLFLLNGIKIEHIDFYMP